MRVEMTGKEFLSAVRREYRPIRFTVEGITITTSVVIDGMKETGERPYSIKNCIFEDSVTLTGMPAEAEWIECTFMKNLRLFEMPATSLYLDKCTINNLILRNTTLNSVSLKDCKICIYNIGTNVGEGNAILSNVYGWRDPIEYMAKNFEKCADGYIAYKTFNHYYGAPNHWVLTKGSVLAENVNPDVMQKCGCGINVGTAEYIKEMLGGNDRGSRFPVWKCLIRWEWLPGVVIPHHTGGKIRCSKVELLEEGTLIDLGAVREGD